MKLICGAVRIVAVLLVGLIVLALVLSAVGLLDTSPETCEDLAPSIIELSEDNAGPFSPEILKISRIRTLTPTGNNVLECSGDARWSRGDDSPIDFFLEEDADGDRFIGYRAESQR